MADPNANYSPRVVPIFAEPEMNNSMKRKAEGAVETKTKRPKLDDASEEHGNHAFGEAPDNVSGENDSASDMNDNLASGNDDGSQATEVGDNDVSEGEDSIMPDLAQGEAEHAATISPFAGTSRGCFPFLHLPAEVRLIIYRMLFKLDRPVIPKLALPPGTPARHAGFPPGVVRALTLANKQLSWEVTHFIYSHNNFRLDMVDHRGWIPRIGSRNANLLRDVTVVGDGRTAVAATHLSDIVITLWKRAHQNLRRLTFVMHDRCADLDGGFIARQLCAIGATRTWSRFQLLEQIQIDMPHYDAPTDHTAEYEALCVQSRIVVLSRHRVDVWWAVALTMAANPNTVPVPRVWLRVEPADVREAIEEAKAAELKTKSGKRRAMRKAKEEKKAREREDAGAEPV